jgi:hypothetical protein
LTVTNLVIRLFLPFFDLSLFAAARAKPLRPQAKEAFLAADDVTLDYNRYAGSDSTAVGLL